MLNRFYADATSLHDAQEGFKKKWKSPATGHVVLDVTVEREGRVLYYLTHDYRNHSEAEVTKAAFDYLKRHQAVSMTLNT